MTLIKPNVCYYYNIEGAEQMMKKLTGLILAYGFGYALGFIGIITVFGVIGS